MRYLLIVLAISLLVGCNPFDSSDEDKSVNISFILDNDLLWNIGHDYKVGGVDEDGNSFMSEEKYIRYIATLISSKGVKKDSKLTLYKNGNPIWESEKVKKSGTYTYHDTPYSGGDYVTFQ